MYHLDDCARTSIVIYMNLFINSDIVAIFFITVLVVNMLCTLKCLKYFALFFGPCTTLWRNSVTKQYCDGNRSQCSVTNCDGMVRNRHNLWRKVTESVTKLWRNPSQFPSPSHKQLVPTRSSSGNCDGLSVTNGLWRKNSVTISVTNLLWWAKSSQIFRHKKLWRTLFRHNFRHNFICDEWNCDGHIFVTISVTNCTFPSQ